MTLVSIKYYMEEIFYCVKFYKKGLLFRIKKGSGLHLEFVLKLYDHFFFPAFKIPCNDMLPRLFNKP